jgi:hypothetical protein
MAVVDFTLDDIEVRFRKIVKLELMEAEGRIKPELKDYIDTADWELKTELLGELNPRLDRLEHEMKGVKRVVNQHSVEILELKVQVRPA